MKNHAVLRAVSGFLILASCSNPLFTPDATKAQAGKSFAITVEVGNLMASNRSLMSDGAVAEVQVEVFSPTGTQVGSGSLTNAGTAWKGKITIEETGQLTFVVSARNGASEVLYSGISTTTISGTGDAVSVAVSSGVIVVYNANGVVDSGSAPVDTTAYNEGVATLLGNPGTMTRDGAIFCGWNTAADGSGTNYAAGNTLTTGTSIVMLYGVWVPSDTLTITGTSLAAGSTKPTGHLIIPPGITTISQGGFDSCPDLLSLTFGPSVTSIGESAFYGNTGLTAVVLPSGLTSLGPYAFAQCDELTSFSIDAENPSFLTDSGVLFNHDQTQLLAYPARAAATYSIPTSVTTVATAAFMGCESLTTLTFPETLTTIGENAFYGCKALTGLTLPADLASLGWQSFASCEGLTSLVIPAGLPAIGSYAFTWCTGLASVTISEGVTSIGSNAFTYCSALTAFTIPSTVTSIGDNPFLGATLLSEFTVEAGNTDFSVVSGVLFNAGATLLIAYPEAAAATYTMPSSVTTVGPYAFGNNGNLTEVTLSSNLTAIGMGAFMQCDALTAIDLPDGLTSVGQLAFMSAGLTAVTIPSSVTSLERYAFGYCSSLASVVCEGTTPAVLETGAGTFDNTASGLQIVVPSGLTSLYQGSPGWSDYAAKITELTS